MAIRLYDNALVEKLSSWTSTTNLTILNPNDMSRLIQLKADMSNDKPLKLPVLALTRNGGYSILTPTKRPISFDGFDLHTNKDRSIQLNAIPVSIQYQLDVYTRYFEEADEYMRNIVFNIINFPKLTIRIPYQDEQREHDANVRLLSEVEDNSDIPERLIPGQFTRLSLSLYIDDAYLWDVRTRNNLAIDFQLDVDNQ